MNAYSVYGVTNRFSVTNSDVPSTVTVSEVPEFSEKSASEFLEFLDQEYLYSRFFAFGANPLLFDALYGFCDSDDLSSLVLHGAYSPLFEARLLSGHVFHSLGASLSHYDFGEYLFSRIDVMRVRDVNRLFLLVAHQLLVKTDLVSEPFDLKKLLCCWFSPNALSKVWKKTFVEFHALIMSVADEFSDDLVSFSLDVDDLVESLSVDSSLRVERAVLITDLSVFMSLYGDATDCSFDQLVALSNSSCA